jgi:fructose-1,6-bisphosphatase/inositol monophosphatase family enzyme
MVEFTKSLEENGTSVRNNGCCTADICGIAEGVLDGRANSNLERWDVDAARIILAEAGGDYRMRRTNSGKIEFIATNGEIQEELEELWDNKTSSENRG